MISGMASPIRSTITDLDAPGSVPAGLAGRLVAIGAGAVHSIELNPGEVPSYRCRRLPIDTNLVSGTITAFAGSYLAFDNRSVSYELSSGFDIVRPIDLAGRALHISTSPTLDPITQGLHFVAARSSGAQAHVVVSPGAFTRRIRSLDGAPGVVKQLTTTRDHVVFATDGFAGVTTLDVEAAITWIPTGVEGALLIHAHDSDDEVVVLALTPALERWTFNAASATVCREVLDRRPRHFASVNGQVRGALRSVWTTSAHTATKHDLHARTRVDHHFTNGTAERLVFVDDAARTDDDTSGWLVGYASRTAQHADFVVLDAHEVAARAAVTLQIPGPIAARLNPTWIPSTHQNTPSKGHTS